MTILDGSQISAEIENAVEEIRSAFPKTRVNLRSDGHEGVVVLIESVPLASSIYRQLNTWIGFQIGKLYPHGDIYPHYVRGDLSRVDGKPFQAENGFHSGDCFQDRAAVKLSRKSHRWNPTRDTALIKLQKVLQWLNNSQ